MSASTGIAPRFQGLGRLGVLRLGCRGRLQAPRATNDAVRTPRVGADTKMQRCRWNGAWTSLGGVDLSLRM